METDFGDIAVDVMSVIREGNLDGLQQWVAEYCKSDAEGKESKKKEVRLLRLPS